MENKKVIFCVVFLIIGFIASTQQVDVTMKTSRKAFAEQYGIVTLEITNNDSENFRFLTYQTVFEDFIGADMFEVKTMAGEEEMSYMGPLARRISPAPPSAYLEVAVGTSLSVDFNITEYYSITRSGFFSITSKMEVFSPYKLTSLNLFLFPNKEVFSFEKENNNKNNNNKQVANKYTNCNTEEKGQVDSSTNTAITQASKAYDCMAANSCSQLADTWFGAYTTSNYNYDLNCFYNIETTLKNNGINAYCNPAGCGANVYAYVYPADPAQTVYLCGAFWSQPLERPNTIVHEMSHFNVIAGTDDYTYGRASCKTLANNNPYQASRNADNVCYFSEDSLGF